MDIAIAFIRNGATKGGLEGRFLGRSGESLSPESAELLRARAAGGVYPKARLVFAGATARCYQTAAAVYPGIPAIILKELSDFDYGDFSGFTYDEAVADSRFGAIARPAGFPAFPGGEDPYVFSARCGKALRRIAREAQSKNIGSVGVITHLSVIKALLQSFVIPRSFYNDWQADYCGGYAAVCDARTFALRIAGQF